MQAMELAILDWVQTNLRCGFLDGVLPAITRLSDHGEIWIVLAAVLLITKKYRWAGVSVTAIALLVPPPGDASFPSGHTAASFTAVTALWCAGGVPKWLRWPALALAVVIALSRIYLYVHWPTDVLGGAALGAALGWAGAWLTSRLRSRLTGRA